MEVCGFLQNVFMYLLCNLIDYGIEFVVECIVYGKLVVGIIDIEVGVDQGMLQIMLCDDG